MISESQYPDTDTMLRIALDIGEHMLIYGADVTRVEDAVTRICRRSGVEHIEVFCIASLLQVSVRMSDGQYAFQMRRIHSNGNNLARLEELNDISRRLCRGAISFDDADRLVKEANHLVPHKPLLYYIAAILGSSAFCIFFGGSPGDGLAAAVAAVPVMYMEMHGLKRGNQLIHTILEAFTGGIIGNAVLELGVGDDIDLICIGVLMLLIPGLKFGNAMHDFVKADVLAGSAKLVHALLLTLMIVMGLSLSMLCFGRWTL